jgi:hypothetical protein
MMLLLLALVEQALEQHLALQKQDLKQLAFPSYSLLVLILLLLKEESMQLLETCIKMIGDGIFMIQ